MELWVPLCRWFFGHEEVISWPAFTYASSRLQTLVVVTDSAQFGNMQLYSYYSCNDYELKCINFGWSTGWLVIHFVFAYSKVVRTKTVFSKSKTLYSPIRCWNNLTLILLEANFANIQWCKKSLKMTETQVLMWEYSVRAIQWIPTWQGLGGFQKPFRHCALDGCWLSIRRFKSWIEQMLGTDHGFVITL